MHPSAECSRAEAIALLVRGADPNSHGQGGYGGVTPLMLATQKDTTPVFRLLLEKGADSKAIDANGRTLLLHASSNGNADAVDQLVARGASVNARDRRERQRSVMPSSARTIRKCSALLRRCEMPARPNNPASYCRSTLPKIQPMIPPAGAVSHPVKRRPKPPYIRAAAIPSTGLTVLSPSDDRSPDAYAQTIARYHAIGCASTPVSAPTSAPRRAEIS